MVIGSLSQQRLESSDSVPLYWSPFMCLERNSPAELWAPFLYLCGPHRPYSGTWGRGVGEVPSMLCGWLMASWTRQFPSKPRGWLVLAGQILRIKNKLKTDRKCRSGSPSRPRRDKCAKPGLRESSPVLRQPRGLALPWLIQDWLLSPLKAEQSSHRWFDIQTWFFSWISQLRFLYCLLLFLSTSFSISLPMYIELSWGT